MIVLLKIRTPFVLCCFTTLAISHPAAAENDEDPFAPQGELTPNSGHGPELGFRLGITTGTGSFEPGHALHDDVAGLLPLWVDAGYRFLDRWFVGAYWQYGIGLSSSTSKALCDTCVHSNIKYGLQVNYSFLTIERTRVWAGLGFGRHSFETVDEKTKRGMSFTGWEPLSVHLGSSWRPTDGVEIGPFFSWSYSTISSRTNVCYEADQRRCPPEQETELPDGGPIWWTTFGVRAVFLP